MLELQGDENGLLSVPRGRAKKVAGAVDKVRSRERRLMDWVQSEQFSREGMRDHVIQ